MKKKYSKPTLNATTFVIEDSISNASSTLTPGSDQNDVVSEYDQLPNDERSFVW